MRSLINFLLKPNYKKFYNILKKLPGIIAMAIVVASFIWSIVDVCVFSFESYYFTYDSFYGIMQLSSPVLSILIWWVIGIVSATISWLICTLAITPTVVKLDAILKIEQKV